MRDDTRPTSEREHPITPPPLLIEQWYYNRPHDRSVTLATWAARWGADQELEACCEWLAQEGYIAIPPRLRAARRPKPLTLGQRIDAELAANAELSPELRAILIEAQAVVGEVVK